MKTLFIKNPIAEDIGFIVNKSVDGTIVNSGPDGTLVVKDRSASLYLIPEVPLVEAVVDITDTIELDGKYVIQVGDDVIPKIFNAEDLGKYFNLNDDSQTGVAFIVEPTMITCANGTSYLQLPYGLSTGPWSIELGGITVAEGLYDDQSIKNFFDANPEYSIVYELFSSGSGSGAAVSEGIFINNNLTIGYPLKISGPNNGADIVVKLNSTATSIVTDDDIRIIEACLNTYSELKLFKARLAINGLTAFEDGSPISNDGLFLEVTFPNGEVINGFLSAALDGESNHYEWDSIGKKATELGYTLGISFGGGGTTFNGGATSEDLYDYSTVYFTNDSDNEQTWRIKGSAILGVFDIDGKAHNGAVANTANDYSVTLGPYSNVSEG